MYLCLAKVSRAKVSPATAGNLVSDSHPKKKKERKMALDAMNGVSKMRRPSTKHLTYSFVLLFDKVLYISCNTLYKILKFEFQSPTVDNFEI